MQPLALLPVFFPNCDSIRFTRKQAFKQWSQEIIQVHCLKHETHKQRQHKCKCKLHKHNVRTSTNPSSRKKKINSLNSACVFLFQLALCQIRNSTSRKYTLIFPLKEFFGSETPRPPKPLEIPIRLIHVHWSQRAPPPVNSNPFCWGSIYDIFLNCILCKLC